MMTQKEWETYGNDVVRAERLLKENGGKVSNNLAWNFREISKRQWNASMYDIPYVSIFEEE